MSSLLVLDTDVLLHLVTTTPKRGQEKEWNESRKILGLQDWEICIPSLALGEVLVWIPREKRIEASKRIQEMFRVLDFDAEAGQFMGSMVGAALKWPRDNRPRQGVKFDVAIVACAVRHGAAGICVYDGHHKAIATEHRLPLQVGPPIDFLPPQQVMF